MNLKVITTIASVVISMFLTTTEAYSNTQAPFFQSNDMGWNVIGLHKRGELNPSCRGDKNYNDGSQFSLVKDLHDEELYNVMHNVSWEISDPPKNYSGLRINFHQGSNIFGLNGNYELLNKNTIRVRNILHKDFISEIVRSSKLMFIMPGSIQNISIDLNGSSNMIQQLYQCIRSYRIPGINL